MSKPWKPGRQTVELRPSKIRREPVRLESQSRIQKAAVISEEREIWGGVAGIVLFAAALAVAILGIAIATIVHGDSASAHAPRFAQCYESDGQDCVLTGDTIYLGGEKLQIAGIDAPEIQGAKCDAERSRGIQSAVQLAQLLNGGKVTTGGTVRGADGEVRTKLEVGGQDVGLAMIGAGAARQDGSGAGDWCSS